MNIGGEIFMGKISHLFILPKFFLHLNIEKIASQRNSNDQLYVNRFFVSSEGHFLSLRKFINHLATILTQLYHECL